MFRGAGTPWHGNRKLTLSENHLRRQQSLANQALRTIEIGEDQIQQADALHQCGGERIPFALGKQQRQRVKIPKTVGALRKASDPLQQSVLAEQPTRLFLCWPRPAVPIVCRPSANCRHVSRI